MHLCMFRDYRMLLANNGLAVHSMGRKPGYTAAIFAASLPSLSLARIFFFGMCVDEWWYVRETLTCVNN